MTPTDFTTILTASIIFSLITYWAITKTLDKIKEKKH